MRTIRTSCCNGLLYIAAVAVFILGVALSPSSILGGGSYVPRSSTAAVAVDRFGNLFVADRLGLVRKVSAEGIVTIFAGYGIAGYSGDGGPATSAQISSTAVTIDPAGDLLIAGVLGASAVRRVTPAGIISTVAGRGGGGGRGVGLISSGDGGPAVLAYVSAQGVAADRRGNVFVVGGNVVRRVTPAGVISTVAGTGVRGFSGDRGPATSVQLDTVQGGIAVDDAGALYIADAGNQRIRKIGPDGNINTIAGSSRVRSGPSLEGGFGGDGKPGVSAELNNPTGVAVDAAGVVYIADERNHRVRLSPDGIITTFAGTGSSGATGDGGPAVRAKLTAPRHMAVDSAGNLFIADEGSNSVRRVDKAGVISTVYPVARPKSQRASRAPAPGASGPSLMIALAAIAIAAIGRRARARGISPPDSKGAGR